MVWYGDGLLRATARPATAVLGGLTFSITLGNKGNKGNDSSSVHNEIWCPLATWVCTVLLSQVKF